MAFVGGCRGRGAGSWAAVAVVVKAEKAGMGPQRRAPAPRRVVEAGRRGREDATARHAEQQPRQQPRRRKHSNGTARIWQDREGGTAQAQAQATACKARIRARGGLAATCRAAEATLAPGWWVCRARGLLARLAHHRCAAGWSRYSGGGGRPHRVPQLRPQKGSTSPAEPPLTRNKRSRRRIHT